MGTTAQKLQAILDSKSDIKDAIEAKGVTVGDAPLDEYASKIGEISGGEEEAPENDVNFYDYDGFRVASYTIAEAKAMTQAQYNAILPPAHSGLTFKEWNWSLSDITSYNRRYIDIGANYEPTDGKCHIKVRIPYDGFEYVQCTGRVAPGATLATTFDWGDGSTQQYSGSTTTHTYAQAGDYDITIYPNSPTDVNYLQINFLTYVAASIPSLGCVREINLAHYTQQSGITGISCPVSFPAAAITINGYSNDYVPIIVIPKLAIHTNALTLSWSGGFFGKVSFPKTITSTKIGNFSQATFKRFIFPEHTDGSAITSIQTWYYCEIISLPASFNVSGANILQGFSKLRIVDIPQGFVPTNSMNLSGSNYFLPPALVDFLTKLGTTSTTITITLGTNNLAKLTEEQKAIATNKGYTLA